jgi:hypothetical protein
VRAIVIKAVVRMDRLVESDDMEDLDALDDMELLQSEEVVGRISNEGHPTIWNDVSKGRADMLR